MEQPSLNTDPGGSLAGSDSGRVNRSNTRSRVDFSTAQKRNKESVVAKRAKKRGQVCNYVCQGEGLQWCEYQSISRVMSELLFHLIFIIYGN